MLPRVLLTNGATQVLLKVITLFQVIIVVGPGNSALLMRVGITSGKREGLSEAAVLGQPFCIAVTFIWENVKASFV